MLTIIFYAQDGEAAKRRARAIGADKPNRTRMYDAMVWNGDEDECDAVEILPCVPQWKRLEIEAVYATKIAVEGADTMHHAVNKRGWPKGKPRKVA